MKFMTEFNNLFISSNVGVKTINLSCTVENILFFFATGIRDNRGVLKYIYTCVTNSARKFRALIEPDSTKLALQHIIIRLWDTFS